jgi:hypothetical protein
MSFSSWGRVRKREARRALGLALGADPCRFEVVDILKWKVLEVEACKS